MSDISNIPRQDLFETTLLSDIDSSTATVVLADAPSFTLAGGQTTRIHVDYDNATNYEPMTVTANTGATLTVTRGVLSYEGGASTAKAHSAGAKVRMSIGWKDFDDIKTAVNSKLDESGGTMTGLLQFSGTDHAGVKFISLTTVQRNALTAANGEVVYDTDLGELYQYIGGAWSAVSAGSTQPNASTTVAGKVEAATSAESIAGIDSGGTGALTFASPSDIAKNVQNNAHIYAATSTGNDDYAITVTPAVTAYAAGQTFIFKADVANTGGATLNVSALGAKTIKKFHDQALETNDIEAGSIVVVTYDGTDFQLQTPVANGMSSANVATLTGAGDASALHNHGHIAKCGRGGRSTEESGTETIAHGLGKTPVMIIFGATTTNFGFASQGSWTSTGNKCVYFSGGGSGSSGDYAIAGVAGSNSQIATAAVDATNITLTWTKGGSGLATWYTWAAYA